MQYTTLGRTGVTVSRICLGTMNFGHYVNEADSHEIMNRALELGINFFDTANVYGGSKGRGTTETYIGNWLADDPSRRDRIVLATKVYGKTADEGLNIRGLSAYHIRKAVEASLKRLRTDHIDLYQMHHIDRTTPFEEIWQAMEQLVREGKVLYVGSSNFAGWHIVQANESARRRNFIGIVSEQSLYHLGNRAIEAELLPACEAYGVGVIPWSPIGGGLLGGALQKLKEGRRAQDRIVSEVEKKRPQVEAYEALCRDIGARPADVALAWMLKNPAITAPIAGPRTIEQLEQNAQAADLELADDVMTRLDEIWPGPGGPAPECYAW
ncbi:aldo/keto reductase [bacterium]|nr:aldo/keto reductase [bacterium]